MICLLFGQRFYIYKKKIKVEGRILPSLLSVSQKDEKRGDGCRVLEPQAGGRDLVSIIRRTLDSLPGKGHTPEYSSIH